MALMVYALAFLILIRYCYAFRHGKLSHVSLGAYERVPCVREDFRAYASLFDEEEVRAVNPPAPCPPPKKPAIYVMEDALSSYRYSNFKEAKTKTRHFASLPYLELRYQDKGSLISYRNDAEIISNYSNKLNTLLSNFQEWTAVFNPDGTGVEDLSLYNPLSSDSYYAIVFYCAWQDESIALKRAISQLCGSYRFIRDPPVPKGPKPREKLEDIINRINEVNERHQDMIKEARSKGFLDPPRPPLEEREQVWMKMHIFNADLTGVILEYLHEHYNYRWWMPKVGQLKYNKVFCKAYNELYNTSYKRVRSDETRLSYKLSNRALLPPPARWYIGDSQKAPGNITRVNFILVRLANSIMLSNTSHGLRRMRNLVNAHEKEMHYNEIMMKLLIDSGVLYKDMPVIKLFRCKNPVDKVPSVFTSKRHELLKFSMYTPFYRPDIFSIARSTLYGLPTLRKCGHLAIPDDFEFLGTIKNLSELKRLNDVNDALPSDNEPLALDFTRIFRQNAKIKDGLTEQTEKLEPFLTTLELLYKVNLKQLLDTRPVPVVYKYLKI